MEALLRARGFNAVRSSVHVNFWPGRFDKLTACRKVVRALGGDPAELGPYLYVGDALNDEPMFRGFPRSVGVANVMEVWDELASKPKHVTRGREGRGFEEVARAILRATAPRR
jgi:hydroxymethylpyrimidine pyrophosphatase-like HAD family hydrolase